MHIESLENRQLFSGGAARFVAQLVGANVVPAVQTPARGVAKLTLSRDGQSLRYQIKAKRIMNADGAHIHLGAAGTVGEIVADLMNAGPMHMGKRSFGAHGTITAAQLTGSLAGHPLADLVSQLVAGTAYVNVHTDDGVAPPNTGPGDFPEGEIRGPLVQIVKRPRTGGSTGGTGGQTGGTGGQTGGQTGGTGGQTGGTGGTGGQTGGTGGGGIYGGMYGGMYGVMH